MKTHTVTTKYEEFSQKQRAYTVECMYCPACGVSVELQGKFLKCEKCGLCHGVTEHEVNEEEQGFESIMTKPKHGE